MTFWNGWEAWQKMVFILGCALVIVIAVALCVLGYRSWRLRKYSRAQSAEQAGDVDLDEITPETVPFGARALERGVQVEGIWTPNLNKSLASPYHSGTIVASSPPPSSPPPLLGREVPSRYGYHDQ